MLYEYEYVLPDDWGRLVHVNHGRVLEPKLQQSSARSHGSLCDRYMTEA
jgi:hypothetical protein